MSVNSAGRSERKNSHEENLPYIADTSILFLGQRPEVYQDRRQDIQLGRKSWSQCRAPDCQIVDDIRLQYKVGYQAAVFARVNIDRFYIQPSLAWQYTEGDIRFNIPQTENSLPDGTNTQMPIGKNRITYKSATLEVPVMIGYYLVKEGPYALSMMFGPNIKYNYKTRYSTDMTDRPREFEDDNTPFGISIAAGLGVSIWRLFLDFSYEFGLNEVASDFREIGTEANQKGTLNIEKRTNIMSFSLGFLF